MQKKDYKILIVDDYAKNIQIIGNILKKEGYYIEFAQSGQEALNWTDREYFDLILLDIMMPEMDGYEVCQRIKNIDKYKDTPIIFLTAKTENEDIVKGFQLGAVDYITKPFNTEELIMRVNTRFEIHKNTLKQVALERKNTALAMAVTANHQINQALSVILGSVDLAMQYDTEEEIKNISELLQNIREGALSISSILKKIKNLEKVEFIRYYKDINMVKIDDDREVQ